MLVFSILLHDNTEIGDLISGALPRRRPACSTANSLSVLLLILSQMMFRIILLACKTRAIVL